MGIVFGMTGTKGPAYAVLYKAAEYEIRTYPGFVTAEVEMTDSTGNNGFPILAKYIGVFGNPANEGAQAMAMTHPVITDNPAAAAKQSGQKIAMTSPVINENNVMKFVLPANYQSVSQAPRPTDPRVIIKETPLSHVAVIGFSGWYSPSAGLHQFQKLAKLLKRDNFIPSPPKTETETTDKTKPSVAASTSTNSVTHLNSASGTVEEEVDETKDLEWQVAQYHPPFTLPFLRLNEVWIKLTPQSSTGLAKLLSDRDDVVVSAVASSSLSAANPVATPPTDAQVLATSAAITAASDAATPAP